MATITFTEVYPLSEPAIKLTAGTIGIYFIYLDGLAIPYPFHESRLIYIGMSESKQNSIGKRLRSHLTGQSGNEGIKNYATRYPVKFTYHSLEVLRILGTKNLFEIESFFLSDFLRHCGSFPICNGQAGIEMKNRSFKLDETSVKWDFFERVHQK